MDYRPTTIQSNERPWGDALAVILIVISLLLSPVTWPLFQLWRYYRLKSHGYYVTRKGRDAIEFQELSDGKFVVLLLAAKRW